MAASVLDIQEIEPGIVQLTMQDREHKNTFSTELSAALVDAFRSISKDKRYRVIILTGYDTYFCSGGTQEILISLHEGKGKFSDTDLYKLPLDCEIPVIAAMQGHGIGGGLIFGLFADFVLFSRESTYTANFMKYGFTPGMGATCVLPEKLGMGLGQEMLLTARSYRGIELAQRYIPFPVLPRAEILPYALELARDLADKPRLSLVTLKSHLVGKLRQALPAVIEQEVAMHNITFHQAETKERIQQFFGH